MTTRSGTAFSTDQFDAIYPKGVERHYWNQCRNAVILDAIRSTGTKGPLLEVGCGKGLVVNYLRSKGCDISGVELAPVKPLPEVMAHVHANMDALDLAHELRVKVDTILLLDVIEHLENPVGFLERLRSGYPSLRHFVITVPARQELFSNYDEFNGHFRRYDPVLLQQHVDDINGRMENMRYFFHALYPPARIQLQLSKKRALAFHVPSRGPASWFHAVIGRLLFIEQKLIPGTWRGTSLIAVIGFDRN